MTASHQTDKKNKKKTKKNGQSADHDKQAKSWPTVTSYPEAVSREVSVPSCSVFPFLKPPTTMSTVWRRNCNYLLNWVGDRYVLGFVSAPIFLRSQILCRLYRSPSGETINRGPPRVYMHAKKDLWSQILCRLYRSPSGETINRGPPCVYTHAKKISGVKFCADSTKK